MTNYFYKRCSGGAAVLNDILANRQVATTVAGTYYPVPGSFDNVFLCGFEFSATPALKKNRGPKQKFEIDWHTTLQSDTANTVFDIALNIYDASTSTWTVQSLWKGENTARVAGSQYPLSGTIALELDKDDEVQIVVASDKAGAVLTFETFQTTIREFLEAEI